LRPSCLRLGFFDTEAVPFVVPASPDAGVRVATRFPPVGGFLRTLSCPLTGSFLRGCPRHLPPSVFLVSLLSFLAPLFFFYRNWLLIKTEYFRNFPAFSAFSPSPVARVFWMTKAARNLLVSFFLGTPLVDSPSLWKALLSDFCSWGPPSVRVLDTIPPA